MPLPPTIAIIGAGLSGTALALSLLHHNPSLRASGITIFESRPSSAPPELSSGVLLTPNGLSILSGLGILPRIASRCWVSPYIAVRNDRDELVSQTQNASEEKHGYFNHRVWRQVLLEALRATCGEKGVKMEYGMKFEGVLGEGEEGVRFKVGGVEKRVGLLVGADGIWSSVRRAIADVVPEYTGVVSVLTHIEWASVPWPVMQGQGWEKALMIQGKPGMIVTIPEDAEGKTIIVGIQQKWDGKGMTREKWERLRDDKECMLEFFMEGYEEWGETARKVLDAVKGEQGMKNLYMWPFLKMPTMERWWSRREDGEAGKVVLVGDAAHAIPPSSGQGVNQGLEDVWSLAMVLGKVYEGAECRRWDDVLKFWRSMRQQRIDGIVEYINGVANLARLPEADRQRLFEKGNPAQVAVSRYDTDWIYEHGIEEEVAVWLESLTS